MRLCSFESPYGVRLGAVVGERVIDLNATLVNRLRHAGRSLDEAVAEAAFRLPPSLRQLLQRGEEGLALARTLIETATTQPETVWHPLTALTLLPPVPDPGKVLGLKGNYRRPGPRHPVWFLKPRTALLGSGQPIRLPSFAERVVHEAELAIIIGRTARDVPAAEAYAYVAGYTLMNDVTASDLAEQDDRWYDRAKGLDTFGPCGPWLVTRDEIPDPHTLRLVCRNNGAIRQDIHTADMIFQTPAIIAHLSRGLTLEPGDIITNGTTCPGPMHAGDRLEIECAEIGVLYSPVVAG